MKHNVILCLVLCQLSNEDNFEQKDLHKTSQIIIVSTDSESNSESEHALWF